MNVIALDIGGTKIFAARYNQDLSPEAQTKVPTQSETDLETICGNIIQAIKKVQNSETKAVGVAWAGFVDREKGQIMKAPNIPALDHFKLTDFITQETGLPAYLENDARAFAYGAKASICPESQMCLGIIIGTGVGSGLIYKDEIIYGANGYAGEIGHITRQNKELEQWLAGPDLKAYLNLASELNFSDILPKEKDKLTNQLTTPLEVFSAWLTGLILTFDPDQIIFGGGTAYHFWRHFQSEIEEQLNHNLKGYPNKFKLHFYEEGNAGARGVAALVFKALNLDERQ